MGRARRPVVEEVLPPEELVTFDLEEWGPRVDDAGHDPAAGQHIHKGIPVPGPPVWSLEQWREREARVLWSDERTA